MPTTHSERSEPAARRDVEASGSLADGREDPVPIAQVVRIIAAAASLGAAAVHASAIAEHTFAALHAATFIAMSVFQASWAYLVLRSTRVQVLVAGTVGHASIVLLWLVTRTNGVPEWLPGPAGREAAGLKDIAATLLAVAALVSIDVLSRRQFAVRTVRSSRAAATVTAFVLTAMVLAAAGSFAVGHEHGRTGPHVDTVHDH